MRQIYRDLLILISLCFLIIFLWFSKGLIFAGGEEGIPFYDLNKTAQFVSYSWQDISGGFSTQLNLNRIPYFNFLKFFYQLGLPGFLVQALHFFIIISTGLVSIYLLFRETMAAELIKKNGSAFKLVPLIGAIFYLLNPFSMIQIWGRGIYMQFFPFALFPFFLLMFVLGLRSKNFIYGVLGILASVFFAGAFGNPSYIFSQWIILSIYLLFYIFKNRSKREVIFAIGYFVFMLIGWIIAHMWWIYPFIKISSNQFSSALNKWNENIGTLRGVSKDYQLPSLLRLIHEGYLYRDQQYGASYLSVPFLLLSLLIPITALFSYPIFKKLKIFVFFGGLFLFSLFICLGSNFPTGWLFILIFKTFPVFQAFRNPFEKFGVVLTIAYAPFFAVGAVVLADKIGQFFKKPAVVTVSLLVLLFLVFGIFLWPIWTGQFAGGVRINPWIEVPGYYKLSDDWLNEQKDDGRIIQFPISTGDGVKYGGWAHPYQGAEPSEFLFDRPSIGKYGQSSKFFYKFLLDRFNKSQPNAYGPDPDFSQSEFISDDLYQELAKLNVRYIILHYDIDPKIGDFDKPEEVANYLGEQKNINKVATFGKLDIYKVNIPDNIHLIYSPEGDLNYSKINPTLYKATVSAQEPFDLYFLENFDVNWEVYVNGKKVENHGRVFSYANKWRIDDTGNLDITVKYIPQDYVIYGMTITKIAILTAGLAVLGFLIWKIKKT